MKKFLRKLALAGTILLCAAASHAADLVQKNAYAYDIRVNSTEQHAPVVTYKLNGLASAVTVKAYANGELVATKAGTVDQSNTVTLDIPDAAYGDITFAIDVTTKTTVTSPTQIKEGTRQTAGAATYGYRFNVPMGVAVNNSTDSKTFGQIIVSEFSAPSGSAYFTSTAAGGRGNALYAFDPQMQPIKNPQANGAYGFSGSLDMATKGEFARVRFSDDGRLFMYSFDAKEGCGVYEFVTTGENAADANSLNSAATQVLTVAKPTAGDVAANCNTTFDVVGKGEGVKIGLLKLNKTAVTYGVIGGVYFYNLGTKKTWTGNPSATIAQGTQYLNTIIRTAYVNCGWDADGKGFNILHRVSTPKTTDEALMHYNMTGASPTCNWESATNAASYFTNVNAAAYNADRTLLAVEDGGTPTYKQLTSFTARSGNGSDSDNITDLGFDYANNLYAVDRTGEYFAAWQLPHQSGGVVTVPAPSSQGYYIEKVELPKLYVVGKFQDWDTENPIELEQDLQGEYVYTFPSSADKGFKLSFDKGNWEAFNAAAIGYGNEGCTILGGHSQQLYANDANNNSGNLLAPCEGTWTITVNEDNLLTLTGKPTNLPEYIYVKGDITGWNGDDSYRVRIDGNFNSPVMTDKGEYKYSATFTDFYGDFKLNSTKDTWGDDINHGAKDGDQNVTVGTTMETAGRNNGNFLLNNKIYAGAKIDFYYNPVANKSSWMNFSGKPRNHYAYNLTHQNNTDSRRFTFHSTGAAEKAVLHFTKRPEASQLRTLASVDEDALDEWGNSINSRHYEVSNVVAGENTVDIPIYWFPRADYDWSVELPAATTEDLITDPVEVGGSRAGLACFTDPMYPEVYGYTVIGRSYNSGIDIYDPTGKKVATAIYPHNEPMGGADANNSSPMDATTRGNEVYFAGWGDSAIGVTAFNLAEYLKNQQSEPYGVFAGTKAGNGLVTASNGNKVGSGTPCVGIWGTGENTTIITFDEDIFGNQFAKNVIGNNNTTTAAAAVIGGGFKSAMLNTNVTIKVLENGFFATQIASNGMLDNSGVNTVSALRWITYPGGTSPWYCGMLASTAPNLIPSAASGIDVSMDGTILALSTYTGINLYNLSWNDDGTPNLGSKAIKTFSYPWGSNTSVRTAVKFDAAGNIHAVNQTYGYFRVLMGKTETDAPEIMAITDGTTTGVEDIVAGAEDDAEAVYFNLNGVRVDSQNLTPGVYVKVAGSTSSKVVIR